MNKHEKLRLQILSGNADANVSFANLRALLIGLGVGERIKGSHHSFRKAGIEEKLNLQSEGSKAKVYKVRQVRNLLLKYDL